MFNTKYRIVKDNYNGFEAQYKPWYLWYWLQVPKYCGLVNSSRTIDDAVAIAEEHARGGSTVIQYLGTLK